MTEINPNVIKIENGIFHPDHACVYDSTGHYIPFSCCYRGKNPAACKPPLKIDVKCENSKRTVVYAGITAYHFGGFLTEGAGRLWYLLENLNDPVIYHKSCELPDFIMKLLAFADIDLKRFIKPSVPTRYKQIIIPQGTFNVLNDCDPKHVLFHEKVGCRLAPNKTINKTLFLSRRKLPKRLRQIKGEERLEHGDVVHPEQLPVEDQVRLINTYDHVAGCIGSAFHLLLFRVTPIKSVTIYCAKYQMNQKTFRMIDNLKNLPTQYIPILQHDPKIKNNRRFVADIKKLKEYI